MTDKRRIKIATAVTALFLAGISAAGLAARAHQPHAEATVAASPDAPSTRAGSYADILEKALGIDARTSDAVDAVARLVQGHDDDD